jgi:hypothetical protein
MQQFAKNPEVVLHERGTLALLAIVESCIGPNFPCRGQGMVIESKIKSNCSAPQVCPRLVSRLQIAMSQLREVEIESLLERQDVAA